MKREGETSIGQSAIVFPSRRAVLKATLLGGVVVGLGLEGGSIVEQVGDRTVEESYSGLKKYSKVSDRFRRKADAISDRDGHLITHPLGTFNYDISSINGRGDRVYPNPHWHPKEENIHGEKLTEPKIEFSQTLLHELSSPFRIEDTNGSGQRINTIIANREGNFDRTTSKVIDPEKPVTIFNGLYGNKVNYRESNYRVEEIARQMPDKLVLAFDPPNQGVSDGLTDVQTDNLEKGSMNEIAHTYLRILSDMGIKKINVRGYSLGTRMSLGIAEFAGEYDITVENLMLYDPPGVDQNDIALPDLAGRIAEDMKALDLHHSSPLDPLLFDLAGLDRPQFLRWLESAWIQTSTVIGDDPLFIYARAMTKSTVEESIWNILQTQSANIIITHGGASKTCPKDQVYRLVDNIKTKLDPVNTRPNQRRRIGTNNMPGAGHLAMVQPRFLAASMKRHLEIPLADLETAA